MISLSRERKDEGSSSREAKRRRLVRYSHACRGTVYRLEQMSMYVVSVIGLSKPRKASIQQTYHKEYREKTLTMSERKKSLLRLSSSSGALMAPTPTPDANPRSSSNHKNNLTIDTKEKSQTSLIVGTPKLAPTSKSSTPQAKTQISSSVKNPDSTINNVEDKPSFQQLDLPEVLIDAHAEIPSISPRDKLSYVEDKKAWKELKQYEQTMIALNILIGEIESAVLTEKPDNIPAFIVDVFFSERNLIEIRKTIEQRSQLLL